MNTPVKAIFEDEANERYEKRKRQNVAAKDFFFSCLINNFVLLVITFYFLQLGICSTDNNLTGSINCKNSSVLS